MGRYTCKSLLLFIANKNVNLIYSHFLKNTLFLSLMVKILYDLLSTL